MTFGASDMPLKPGVYRLAFGPMMNNAGAVLFIGDLTPPPHALQSLAVSLFSEGNTIPVVRPGDRTPDYMCSTTAGYSS